MARKSEEQLISFGNHRSRKLYRARVCTWLNEDERPYDTTTGWMVLDGWNTKLDRRFPAGQKTKALTYMYQTNRD